MDPVVWMLAIAAAALGAWAVKMGRRRLPLPAPRPAAPLPPVDEAEELRRVIEGSAELKILYTKTGHPPDVERDCERLLREIDGLIRTEIPDFPAFRAAVAEAEKRIGDTEFPPEDLALLDEVKRAGDDRDAVIRVLDRAPVWRLLPILEQIPMVRGGEKVWKTPVELTLLRKRPADLARCEKLLDELAGLVRDSRLVRPEKLRADLLETLARVGRDVRRENAFMPTSLRALEAAVRAWLSSAPPEARRRREELDALLLGMLRVRRGDGEDLREAARAQAKRYADTQWMHTQWLTSYALTNLLDAELAALPEEERRRPSHRAGVLRWVRDEVASSHFDSEETILRLRQQEERELYVHSLVYALLRMSRLPDAPGMIETSRGRPGRTPRIG
ncbi:MAG TPA: hypothetical protein VLE27_02445 [Thermoanaerobaculia bacterium]|nr:hypothetical protein [Thermoanaerobaculia bacterium]